MDTYSDNILAWKMHKDATTSTNPSSIIPSGNRLGELQTVWEEPIVYVSLFPCVLLQMANQRMSKAAIRHSHFMRQPILRMMNSLTWIYVMFLGTPKEKDALARWINGLHGKVKGPGYNAHDPKIQIWLAACIYACSLPIYEEILGPMDDAASEKLYHQSFYHSLYLRVPREMLPADRRSFWAYWNKEVELLEVTDDAKAIGRVFIWGHTTPFWTWPGLLVLRIIAAEALPPRVRDAYGLKRRKLLYRIGVKVTKLVYPLVPLVIRRLAVHTFGDQLRKNRAVMLSK